jgi:hypothetical protein
LQELAIPFVEQDGVNWRKYFWYRQLYDQVAISVIKPTFPTLYEHVSSAGVALFSRRTLISILKAALILSSEITTESPLLLHLYAVIYEVNMTLNRDVALEWILQTSSQSRQLAEGATVFFMFILENFEGLLPIKKQLANYLIKITIFLTDGLSMESPISENASSCLIALGTSFNTAFLTLQQQTFLH